MAVKRGFFRRIVQTFMDTTRFIFFDETAANTNMTRLYGRAPVGERLVASVPHGHWKTTTFVAGLSLDGIVAPAVFDEPIDGPSFLAYVEQIVAPCLRPGDVVLMDNLRAHKAPAVATAVRAAGASILFTPPYSPDFNPIEKFFSKLKAYLRRRRRGPNRLSTSRSSHVARRSRARNAGISSYTAVTESRNRQPL